MLGFQIFKHSVVQVLGNWKNALRISGILWLIVAVILPMIVRMILTGSPVLDTAAIMAGFAESSGTFFFAIFVSVVFNWIAVSWIAVAWHRYVLKNELNLNALYIPRSSAGDIAGYMWKGIVLGFVMLLVAIPVTMIFVGVGLLIGNETLLGGIIFTTALSVVITVIMLRFSLVLPARALNSSMNIGESWGYTLNVRSALWTTSMILVVANGILNYILVGFLPSAIAEGVISEIIVSIINWVTMMVGVSILTTLYGYCVEERELI